MIPRRRNAGLGRLGADGFYGSGIFDDDLPEDPPAPIAAPRLRDDLRALDHAIERLKAKPRYDEAALAELQARRREVVRQLAAINGPERSK